ncbi:hypothetical protein COOONC_24231 [Cooperia oncophora]
MASNQVDDQLPTDVEEHNEPGLLHFPNFKNSYAGEYECRGYRNNELIASSSVQVYPATDDTEEVKVEIEPPRVRIVSQGESIVLKCGVEDPKSRVIWWRTENLIDALMVGSTQFLHLHSVDVCERGIYYCTDESTNYGYPHSVNTLVVLQHSLLGAKNGAHFEWALLRGGNIVRKLGNEATLHIKGADPSNDYGVYRCNVEDDNGVVIGSAYTAVSVGYSGQSNAQVVKFDEKSDASFTCPIYSVPGSKVEWSRVDGDLPPNAVPNGNRLE